MKQTRKTIQIMFFYMSNKLELPKAGEEACLAEGKLLAGYFHLHINTPFMSYLQKSINITFFKEQFCS